jgi:hypothetical protein
MIAAIGSIVAATVSSFALIQSRTTHTLINSRMDQLLKMAASLAHAEGVALGEQSQRDRAAPSDVA